MRQGIKTAIGVTAASVMLAGCTLAVTAQPSSAASRPSWDGRNPVVWTAPADPMCLARYAGRHGTDFL